MMDKFAELFAAEEGQGMVEYGLIVGLIAIIVIAVFVALGPQIMELFEDALDVDEVEAEWRAECEMEGGDWQFPDEVDPEEDSWDDHCEDWEDEEENGEE